MKIPNRLITALTLYFLLACGSQPTTDNPAENSNSSAPSPSSEPASNSSNNNLPSDELDRLTERFIGTYAVLSTVTTVQTLPLIGESNTITHAYSLNTISRTDDGFGVSEKGCHVTSIPESGITTEISDVIPQSIPTTIHPIYIWEENGTLQWSRPEKTVLMGAMLDNPANDVLPTSADDSRVWDQDQDGKPGITVSVSGFISGDIYVVQRTINSYSGTITNDDNFEGLIHEHGEQNVLDATNPMLSQNIPTQPHTDPSLNTIQMIRVDTDTTCEQFIQQKESLF